MSAAKRPSVLVPLDGSALAATALPVARALAALLDATLHVAHVTPEALSPREARGRLALSPDDLRGTVLNTLGGDPGAAIVRLAEEIEAQLIVLSRRTATAESGVRLGRVAEHVLRAARCPIVLVPPDRGLVPWSLREVLLPQDGTPAMAGAVSLAGMLAGRAGSSLVVLHVIAPGVERPREEGTLSVPRYVDQPQHEWPAWSREFLARTTCLCPLPEGDRLRFVLAEGDAGEEIARFARALQVDLVVLGWQGALEPARAKTLRIAIVRSPCPVLVMRSSGAECSEACWWKPDR